MKIQKTLLVTGLLVWSASLPAAEPNLIINAGGQMRIQLSVPTDKNVDLTTPVTMGRVDIAPVVYVPGLLGRFSLNALSLSFADFDINRRPFGNHRFRAVGVHLRDAVDVVAAESQPNVFTFTLLPDDIMFYGGALVNGELRAGNERPSQNVTGTLDFNNKTFSAKVVIMKHDEFLGIDVGGPLTITVAGMLAPGSDKDGDGVNDQDDNCVLTPNARIRTGLGQLVQPEVASPVVTPPANVNALTCAGVHPGYGPTAVDICDGLWSTFANDAPASFGPGTTPVTWTATTLAGREGSAIQSVTVTDRTPPSFVSVPPAITFPECRPRGIGVATASDDCDGSGAIVTNNAPAHFAVGRTIVTWTARDRSGNRTTATQSVTATSCTLLP